MARILLTGPVNSGKTTAIDKLIEIANEAGLRTGGVGIEKRLDDSGEVEVLILRDLAAGNMCELARPAENGDPPLGWFTRGRWFFHQEAFVWGNIILARPAPMDLLVIDEIGPLEIEGGGFAPAVWTARAPRMVYVARSGMATWLRPLISFSELEIIELTDENRDDIPRTLATILGINYPY